jgi:hypothetical protein
MEKLGKFIANNLPSEPINVIKEDPQDKNILMLGLTLEFMSQLIEEKAGFHYAIISPLFLFMTLLFIQGIMNLL